MTAELLLHALHHNPGIYFVLRRPLTRSQFNDLLEVLGRRSTADAGGTADQHWAALQERMSGRSRWDQLVPPVDGPRDGVENMRRRAAAFHTTENILNRRPYTGHTVDDVQYVVDVFNPANELELPYRGAGEPVLALLVGSKTNGLIRGGLVGIDSFYEVVQEVDRVLEPEYVRGTYSMASVVFAYLEGRVEASVRPWEFLYPLSVLPHPANSDQQLRELFKRVELWPDRRVLLQVYKGLDATILPNYVTAARALHMTAVQELVT